MSCGTRDDRAAGFLGLEEIEDFAGAGPEEFGLRELGEERAAGAL